MFWNLHTHTDTLTHTLARILTDKADKCALRNNKMLVIVGYYYFTHTHTRTDNSVGVDVGVAVGFGYTALVCTFFSHASFCHLRLHLLSSAGNNKF